MDCSCSPGEHVLTHVLLRWHHPPASTELLCGCRSGQTLAAELIARLLENSGVAAVGGNSYALKTATLFVHVLVSRVDYAFSGLTLGEMLS